MKSHSLLTAILLVLLSGFIHAQDAGSRFAFEIGAGPAYATNNLSGTNLNLGGGFEAIFHYKVMPHAGVYAGWGWNKFSSDNSFAGDNMDFEETGYVFGLEFKHPTGISSTSYYLRAGGLYNHIEIENEDGDITDDTKHGLGFQLATGLSIPINSKWELTPGIKFNSLSRNLKQQNSIRDLNLNYLAARVGFRKQF